MDFMDVVFRNWRVVSTFEFVFGRLPPSSPLPRSCAGHVARPSRSIRISDFEQEVTEKTELRFENKARLELTEDSKGNGVFGGSSLLSLFAPVKSLAVICYTSGGGIGPKNILITFSFPITRTSSCTMQYAAMRTKRMIWMAQKCGQMISASSFLLPVTKPPVCRQKSIRRS